MRGIDARTWARLSPLLDEALDLCAAERASFLRRLDGEQQDLAALLVQLLASHDAAVASAFLVEPLGAAAAPRTCAPAEEHTATLERQRAELASALEALRAEVARR